MKNILLSYILVSVMVFNSCIRDKEISPNPGKRIGELHISKQKPQPGDTISISFKLETPDKINPLEAYYYYSVGPKFYPEDIDLKDSAGVWKGIIIIPDSATAIVFNFQQNNKILNNSKKGYFQPLYDKNGSFLPGSMAAIGFFYQSMGDQYEIKNDSVLAMVLSELNKYPELENEWDESFSFYLYNSDNEKGEKFINKRIKYYSTKPSLTQKEYSALNRFFELTNDRKKIDSLNLITLEKFPTGNSARNLHFQEFYKEQDLNKKEKLFEEFSRKFGEDPPGFERDFMLSIMTSLFAKNKNWKKFDRFSRLIKDKNEKANNFNNIGWDLAEKAENLERAAELSKQSLELLNETTEADKPEYLTRNQFKKNKEYTARMYYDTYAFILFQQGKYEDAIKYQKIAVAEGKNSEYNERYLLFLMTAKKYKEARVIAEIYLRENTATAKTKEYFKEAFSKTGGDDQNLIQKISQLEEEAKSNALETLKMQILNEEATNFSLVNLEGSEISLSSFKGKTVILDFWATWCGPCTASFPGMQKAVNKYKDDDKVQFLFINTMENIPDRNKEITAFIKKNNYNFIVLMDQPVTENSRKFKTATDYSVYGIPTKIIIGPNGKIGFKKIGYGANDEEMIQEIDLMIQLLNSPPPPQNSRKPVS